LQRDSARSWERPDRFNWLTPVPGFSKQPVGAGKDQPDNFNFGGFEVAPAGFQFVPAFEPVARRA
jgi:hypothetical protein